MDKERKENTKNLLQGEELFPVNRKFKSRLFEMIFSDKKELLGLYNAVSGKHYTDPELLAACKTLADYSEYTARVRRYAKEMALEQAVERAITECIKEGILADFLSRKRAEAKSMSIYEYDEEKHMRQEREEHFQKGVQEGIQEGRQQGISKLINACRKLGVERDKIILQLAEEYSLSREEAEQYMERYWK